MSATKSEILKDAGLLIETPLDQTPLVDNVTPDQIPKRIVNRYRSKNKLRCAVCRTENKHNSGVTLELSDGHLALCGLTCATGFFGKQAIGKLMETYDAQERHSILRNKVGPTIDAFENAVSRISDEWIAADDSIEYVVKIIGERRNHRVSIFLDNNVSEELKMLKINCQTSLSFQKARMIEARLMDGNAKVTDVQIEKLQRRRRHIADNLHTILEKHQNAKRLLNNPAFVALLKNEKIPIWRVVDINDLKSLWKSLNRS